MTTIKKVVLIGASGVLGSAILHALQKHRDLEITILSRKDSQSQFPPNLTVIKTDYSLPSLEAAFKDQHVVICATGLSGISLQKAMIDACVATGVHRYITNDFGNAPDFVGLSELEFTRTPKIEVLEYAKQQARQNDGYTWTALATGHFVDLALKKFPAAFGFDLGKHEARIVDGGTEPFSSTMLSDIGDAVVGILRRPDETANKYLLVRTLETTQNEILRALQEQTGKKWAVQHIASGELYESGKAKLGRGEKGAILDLLPVQIFESGIGRSTFPRERYDNALLGIGEKSVDQMVRDVLASF